MAKNSNTGLLKPLFNNEIIRKSPVKYGFLSLLIFFSGLFLFPSSAYLADITSGNIVEMTNQERLKKEAPSLRINDSLNQAARQKAKAILAEQEFRHELGGRKFSYWIKKAEYDYKYAGENLAIDFVEAENVVSSWMDSDSHRRNILNPKYREIGVSILKGDFQGQKTIVVVQIFGTPEAANRNLPVQNSHKNNEQKLSSSALQLTSALSGKLFLLENIFPDIRQHRLLQGYKYFIFISVFALFLFYITVYLILSKKECR
jgi:hypothetical protein